MRHVRASLREDGEYGLHRCTDHAVLQHFGNRLRTGWCPQNLSSTEVALRHAVLSSFDRIAMIRLFGHAVSLLRFDVPEGTGLLYSGQYGLWRSGSELEKVDVWQVAERLRSRGRRPLAATQGGQWLGSWNLKGLLGSDADDIWLRASAEYAKALVGSVDVVLAYPEFKSIFRSTEGRLLFANHRLTRITYHVEHQAAVPSASAGWQIFDDNGVTYARKQTQAHGKAIEFLLTVGVSHLSGVTVGRAQKGT